MPLCPHCGRATDPGASYCRSCGLPLGGTIITPQSPLARENFSPAHPQPQGARQRPQYTDLKPHVSLSTVQLLGIAGIILVVAAAAFFVFSGSPLTAGNQTNSTGISGSSGLLPVFGQCDEGTTSCNGKCVDLQSDPDNCGSCGFSVPYGETCVNGQFSGVAMQKSTTTVTTTPTRVSCPAGQSACSGTCRDLATDAGNCGACGNACPSGQTCGSGQCIHPVAAAPVVSTSVPATLVFEITCSGRETLCGNTCVDLFSDKNHCGVCSRACGSSEICLNARCGPACTVSGTSLCNEVCVDLETDTDNCGTCGTECPSLVPNAKGSLCSEGKCIISQCKPDYGDCDKNSANGCEANLALSAASCGTCGTVCPEGQVCYNRKCSPPITST